MHPPGRATAVLKQAVEATVGGVAQQVVFDVSRDPDTLRIDINAQMERSVAWVARALEPGVSPPLRRLLVVGGGLAGLAGATYALMRGIDVQVVDPRTGGGGQPLSSRRWVHPTMYDWPAPHWALGFDAPHPPNLSGVPDADQLRAILAWQAGAAGSVTDGLRRRMVDRLQGHIHRGYVLAPKEPRPGLRSGLRLEAARYMRLSLAAPDGPATLTLPVEPELHGAFDRVLVCRGPVERAAAVRGLDGWHGGRGYWEAGDPLIWGMYDALPGDPRKLGWSVLAVGAGDGGRQDMVHLLTGVDICRLVERLNKVDARWMEELRARAEAAYVRANQGEGTPRRTDPHEVIRTLAEETRAELLERLRRVGVSLDEGVLQRTSVLEYKKEHEAGCFPLNRYLTLTLAHELYGSRYRTVVDANEPSGRTHDGPPLTRARCARKRPPARHALLSCDGRAHQVHGTWRSPAHVEYLLVRPGLEPAPFGGPASTPGARPDWSRTGSR